MKRKLFLFFERHGKPQSQNIVFMDIWKMSRTIWKRYKLILFFGSIIYLAKFWAICVCVCVRINRAFYIRVVCMLLHCFRVSFNSQKNKKSETWSMIWTTSFFWIQCLFFFSYIFLETNKSFVDCFLLSWNSGRIKERWTLFINVLVRDHFGSKFNIFVHSVSVFARIFFPRVS